MTDAPLYGWADLMRDLEPLADRVLANTRRGATEVERQDTWAMMMQLLAQGAIGHVNANPHRPDWSPQWNWAINSAAPNCDFMYQMCDVDGAAVYRLSGYRGTCLFVNVTCKGGEFFFNRGPTPSLASYDLDDLTIDKDGYFSVVLSGAKPEGYTGDWWPLHADTKRLMLRTAAYDWNTEIDPRIAIERLDGPIAAPPLPPQERARRMANIVDWIETEIDFSMRQANLKRSEGLINKLGRTDYVALGVGAVLGQVYDEGIFEIADDEALVIDTEVPSPCRYWSILVADDRWLTVDWVNRQSSLNGAQARLDLDGRLRAVIAKADPGVPNWIDTGGLNTGTIQVRFNTFDKEPAIGAATKVKLADLRAHLPADTPAVTPAERDKQLRKRREGAQLRRRW